MQTLLILISALLCAHAWCVRRARRADARLMRPADDLTPEDLDRWLELIEPCELPDPTGQPQG